MRRKQTIKRNADSTKQYLKTSEAGLKLGMGGWEQKEKCLGALLTITIKQVTIQNWLLEGFFGHLFQQWVWSPMATATDIPLDHSYVWIFPSQLSPDQPTNHLWSPFLPIRAVAYYLILPSLSTAITLTYMTYVQVKEQQKLGDPGLPSQVLCPLIPFLTHCPSPF